MKYARFEWLILSLGGVIVVGTLFVSPLDRPMPQEIVAQLMIAAVLFGAVHWGRDGGFIAAIAATLVYVIMRIPLLSTQGLDGDVVTMIVTRAVTYGLIGIVGGEVCGRIKYFFARAEGSPLIDDVTGVYNARYAGQAIRVGVGQWQRYETLYSVVRVTMIPTLIDGLRPSRQRTILRSVASYIRNDIRMVDDVAYAADGEFLVLLPQTSKGGALVASDRLRLGVRDLLGAKDESVGADVFSVPEDAEAMRTLADRFDPKPEPGSAEAESTAVRAGDAATG